jgi:hypothetical protein
MVFTKQVVAFTRSTNDEIVDAIKLDEVRGIKDNSARDQTGQINLEPENSNRLIIKSEYAKKMMLQIETTEDGYNAGRIYTIRMKSEREFEAISNDLTRLCRIARDKAETRSKFKQIQVRVSKVFNSNLIQGFLALLIFAVNASCILNKIPVCFEVVVFTEFRGGCFRNTSQCTDSTRRLI